MRGWLRLPGTARRSRGGGDASQTTVFCFRPFLFMRGWLRRPGTARRSRGGGDASPGNCTLKLFLIILHLTLREFFLRGLRQLETIVRAKGNAAAAVDADEGVSGGVKINGVYGAGSGARPATDAEALPHDDAATFPVGIGPCGTGFRTGSHRITGEAMPRLEPRGQPAGRSDADAHRIP